MAELEAKLVDLARGLARGPEPAPVAQLLDEELRLARTEQLSGTYMTTYSRLHIPGLLQTEAWARAVMGIYEFDPEVVERGWDLRKGRQELMQDVPQEFFIGEAALRGTVLRPEHRKVHRDQLGYLQQQATRPTVDVRVLSRVAERSLQDSYHRREGLQGAPFPEFVLLQGVGGEITVYSDGLEEGSVIEPSGILQGQAGERILEQQRAMARLALSSADSMIYIADIIDIIPSPLSQNCP